MNKIKTWYERLIWYLTFKLYWNPKLAIACIKTNRLIGKRVIKWWRLL